MVKKTCNHKKSIEINRFDNQPILQCKKCFLIYIKNKKKNKNVLYNDYYKNEIPTRFHFGLELIIKLFRFFRAFKLFTVHPKAKSILDVGSGRGFTLYYLKKFYKYKKAIGTQLCRSAVEFSRKKLGLKIHNKDLLKINFNKEKFDLITMWHVLEHVEEPEKYIKKIHSLLNKNGKYIIEVPNFDSWTRKFTGKYWLGMDLKYHLTFFTEKSITKLLKKHGFKISDIHTFSLEYSTFLSAQSIVSKITKTDQLFFNWLQTKNQSIIKIIPHLILFILLIPFCTLINFLSYYEKWGEVLLITAEK